MEIVLIILGVIVALMVLGTVLGKLRGDPDLESLSKQGLRMQLWYAEKWINTYQTIPNPSESDRNKYEYTKKRADRARFLLQSDAELWTLFFQAAKAGDSGTEDCVRIEQEMKRRGILNDESTSPGPAATESHSAQLAANQIRAAAREAYDQAFKATQAKGKPEQVCYENGLTNVLFSRLQACPGAPPMSDEIIKVIVMEATPFRILTPQEGMNVIVEYVVWREYPNLANEHLISDAVHRYIPTLAPDLLQYVKEAPYPWVKFLSS